MSEQTDARSIQNDVLPISISRHRDELSEPLRKRTDTLAGSIRSTLDLLGCDCLSDLSGKVRTGEVSPGEARDILSRAAVLEKNLDAEPPVWESYGLLDTVTVDCVPDYLIRDIKILPDGNVVLTRYHPASPERIFQSVIDPDTGSVMKETGIMSDLLAVVDTKIIGYAKTDDPEKPINAIVIWDYQTGDRIRPFASLFPTERIFPVFVDKNRLYTTRLDLSKNTVSLLSHDLVTGQEETEILHVPQHEVIYPYVVRCMTPQGNLLLQEMEQRNLASPPEEYRLWDPVQRTVIQSVYNHFGQEMRSVSDNVLFGEVLHQLTLWDVSACKIETHASRDLWTASARVYPDPVLGNVLIAKRGGDFIIFDLQTDRTIKTIGFPPGSGMFSNVPDNAFAVLPDATVLFGQYNTILKYGPK